MENQNQAGISFTDNRSDCANALDGDVWPLADHSPGELSHPCLGDHRDRECDQESGERITARGSICQALPDLIFLKKSKCQSGRSRSSRLP